MEDINIEFEYIEGLPPSVEKYKGIEGGVRRDFRIPLDEGSNIYVVINNCSYKLSNLSSVGFQFILDNIKGFQIDREYPFTLNLNSDTVNGVGKIKYFQKNDNQLFLGGVEIISISDEDKKKLFSFISSLKREILRSGRP